MVGKKNQKQKVKQKLEKIKLKKKEIGYIMLHDLAFVFTLVIYWVLLNSES